MADVACWRWFLARQKLGMVKFVSLTASILLLLNSGSCPKASVLASARATESPDVAELKPEALSRQHYRARLWPFPRVPRVDHIIR